MCVSGADILHTAEEPLGKHSVSEGSEERCDKILQDVTSGGWPDSSDPGPLSGTVMSSVLLRSLTNFR